MQIVHWQCKKKYRESLECTPWPRRKVNVQRNLSILILNNINLLTSIVYQPGGLSSRTVERWNATVTGNGRGGGERGRRKRKGGGGGGREDEEREDRGWERRRMRRRSERGWRGGGLGARRRREEEEGEAKAQERGRRRRRDYHWLTTENRELPLV